jgi:hypothetical protein
MDMAYLSQYSSFLSKFAPLHTTIQKIESQHHTLESSLPTLLTNLNQSLKCNKSFLESLVNLTQTETELLQKEKFLSELVNSSSIDRDQQRSLFNMNATKDDGVLREIDYINSTIVLVKQLKDIEIAMKENYPLDQWGVPVTQERDIGLLRNSLTKNLEELKVTSMKRTTDLLRKNLSGILMKEPEKLVKLLNSVKNLKEFKNLFVQHYEASEKSRISKVLLDLNLSINNDHPNTFLQYSFESLIRFLQFDLFILQKCFSEGSDIGSVHVLLTRLYNDPLKELKSL